MQSTLYRLNDKDKAYEMVRLRAHHLLCMLTYIGRGYTQKYIENFDAVAARISSGAHILIVKGEDDICAAMTDAAKATHCHHTDVGLRDTFANQQLETFFGVSLFPGRVVSLEEGDIDRLREAFTKGDVRKACDTCGWNKICSTIAENNYAGAKVIMITPQAGLVQPPPALVR